MKPSDARAYAENVNWKLSGLGFLNGWVYSAFFTDALIPLSDERSAFLGLFWITSLLSVSLGLLATLLLYNFLRPLLNSKAAQYVSGSCVSLGSIGIALANAFGGEAWALVGFLGAALTGLGAAFLYTLWGILYCSARRDETEQIMPVAMLIAMLVTLLMFLLRGWGTVVLVAALPLVSIFMYRENIGSRFSDIHSEDAQCGKPARRQEFRQGSQTKPKWSGSLIRAALPIFILWVVYTFLRESVFSSSVQNYSMSYFPAIATGVLVAMISLVFYISNARSLTFLSIYKLVIPLTFLSMLLVLLLDTPHISVSYSFSFASLLLFDAYIWLLCPVLYQGKRGSLINSAILLRFAVQFGGFVGALLAPFLLDFDRTLVIPALMTILASTVFITLPEQGLKSAFEESAACVNVDSRTPEDAYGEKTKLLAVSYGLSNRETEILGYLVKGRDLPYIRDTLYISRNTVNTHIKHIYTKLGIHTKQELIDLFEATKSGSKEI